MKKYLIYGKVKHTVYSIVNRSVEDAVAKAQKLQSIIKGEDFYVVEAVPHPFVSFDQQIANLEEFLKGAIRVLPPRSVASR